jgi:hypothetical protein
LITGFNADLLAGQVTLATVDNLPYPEPDGHNERRQSLSNPYLDGLRDLLDHFLLKRKYVGHFLERIFRHLDLLLRAAPGPGLWGVRHAAETRPSG